MKNTLKVIAVLVVFIIGIIIIDVIFVQDKEKEEQPETIDFELSFLIDSMVGEYEVIEFTDEEVESIANELSKLNYTKVDVELAYLGGYKLVFDGKELIFDDNNDPYGEIYVDGEYYTIYISSLKETILDYVAQKDLVKVYLYSLDADTFEFAEINLTDETKKLIQNYVVNTRPLEVEEMVDLAIVGEYMLIVDNETIYFDDLSGYAMYNGELAMLDTDLVSILENYIYDFSNEECCSCCPDAGPDEVCISACCACN